MSPAARTVSVIPGKITLKYRAQAMLYRGICPKKVARAYTQIPVKARRGDTMRLGYM